MMSLAEAELVRENSGLRSRLREAVEALRAIRGDILSQINAAVLAVDSDGRVTYLNAAAERECGEEAASAHEHFLRRVTDLVH